MALGGAISWTREAEPLPSFWTPRQDSAWERIKEALHRDWLQTKRNFMLEGGAELGQSAADTLEKARAYVAGARR